MNKNRVLACGCAGFVLGLSIWLIYGLIVGTIPERNYAVRVFEIVGFFGFLLFGGYASSVFIRCGLPAGRDWLKQGKHIMRRPRGYRKQFSG